VQNTTPRLFLIAAGLSLLTALVAPRKNLPALALQLHDTYYVVPQGHLITLVALFFSLTAGLYYLIPKLTGKLPGDVVGMLHFSLTIAAMALIFFAMWGLSLDEIRRHDKILRPAAYLFLAGCVFIGAQFLFVVNMIVTLFRRHAA
jgi:cytochrome c oxidase subunit 1